MSYTFEPATENRIVGRVVGETKSHIAFRIGTNSHGDKFLAAVSRDGTEYVTWQYGFQSGHLAAFWGHYFTNFEDANADFERRVSR